MTREHGGPDALGVAPWDFSTNANACGPCPAALAALERADARHYPDPAYTALREALAGFHAVDAARIAIAGSASEFIGRFTAWVAREGGRRVWLPEFAYGDYATAAEAWRLSRAQDPARAQLAWLCEPASPLGTDEPEADRVLASGAPVVLDRAYEPLRLQGRGSLDTAALEHVWQLWTPNKALGLTGVRGAYAIAPRHGGDAVQALDRLAPSWPLGAHAVAMLEAWVDPAAQDWLARSREQLRDWKALQLQRLAELGWAVAQPGVAHFFVAEPLPPGTDGRRLAAALRALRGHGVRLRDTASFGLPGRVRVAVLPPQAQSALARAWKAVALAM